MSWQELFVFDVSPLTTIVRGTLVFWALLVLFRVVLRQDTGAIGMADVLLIVLVADAAQNAMSADYRSVSNGLLLVATLMFWNVVVDWAAYRFERLRGWLEPAPLPLIEDGRVLHRNLRREFMSLGELQAKLREHGVEDLQSVRRSDMESDGTVTVLLKRGVPGAPPAASGRPVA